MSRISKQKRNQLILVALVTLLVVAGLWLSLIRYQQDNLVGLAGKIQKSRITFSQIQDTIRNSQEIEASLNVLSNRLAEQEGDMASGDLYKSMINIIKSFKAPYRVDIPEFHSGGDAAPVNLLPKFPYKQVTLGISGTAYYFDLGRFVADFENQFPSSRISNLELVPASASGPEEKLSFRMDIISLVKPGGARPASTP
jgi:Tfp pilus assembly protein PilO